MEIKILLVILAGLVIVYALYASIIKNRNKALEALSGIDVQLNKRHDLIPNILTIAKKFMEHERGLLTEVTELRAQAMQGYDKNSKEQVAQHLSLESALQGKMGQLMVAVEAYPDLKSDTSMVTAQQTYNEVEENIAASRRFYNSAVNQLNNSVQIFPSSMIAGWIGIGEMPLFEADESVKAPVNAQDFL